MKKLLIVLFTFILLTGSTLAINFFGDLDMKQFKIYNVTNVTANKFLYQNGTELLSSVTYSYSNGTLSNYKVVDKGNATDFESKVEACNNETIIVPDGLYDLRSQTITITKDGCTIQGFGNAVLNIGNASGANPKFWIQGSAGATKYAVNVSISPNSPYATFNGISAAVKVGDILLINGGSEKGTDGNGAAVAKEEMQRIAKFLGNGTLYFEAPFDYNYSQAYGANASIINAVEHFRMSGFIVNGTGAEDDTWCIYITYDHDTEIFDNEIMNCGRSGVEFSTTYRTLIRNNNIHDINKTAQGYSVNIKGASKFVTIKDNLVTRVDEFADCAGSGFPSHIVISGNTVKNSPNGLDTHPQCYYIDVFNNIFENIYNTSNLATGKAITPSAMHMVIEGNIFRNISRWAVDVDGEINWSGNDRYIYDITINNNKCYEVGLGCIKTSAPDCTYGCRPPIYNQTFITNNLMYQYVTGGTGISISYNSSAFVSGNKIFGFTTGISADDIRMLGSAVNTVDKKECYGNCTHYMYRNSTGHIITI